MKLAMSLTHTFRGSSEWPETKGGLATSGPYLSLCLTGEALTVVGRMSAEDVTDFAKLKATLLQSFDSRKSAIESSLERPSPTMAKQVANLQAGCLGILITGKSWPKLKRRTTP